MKLKDFEKKSSELVKNLPKDVRLDFLPTLSKPSANESGFVCQMKVEELYNNAAGDVRTLRKVTVFAEGSDMYEAQYNALRLALVQIKVLGDSNV